MNGRGWPTSIRLILGTARWKARAISGLADREDRVEVVAGDYT
jgi:hypothetical protein